MDNEIVIQGWVARDDSGDLLVHHAKPKRVKTARMWVAKGYSMSISNDLFPDLTWDSDPLEVEIIIKRKKNK